MRLIGTSQRDARPFKAPVAKCSVCGNEGKNGSWRFGYFQVLGLPVLPVKRAIHSKCPSCGTEATGTEHSHEDLQAIQPFAGRGWPPLYLFSGLVLVALSIIYGVRAASASHEQQLAELNQPMVNDQYMVKTVSDPATPYQLFLVTRVSDQMVFGHYTKVAHPTPEGFHHDVKANLSLAINYWNRDSIVGIERTLLLGWQHSGILREIWRQPNAELITQPTEGQEIMIRDGATANYRLFRIIDVFPDSIYGRYSADVYAEPIDFKRDQSTGRHKETSYWETNMTPLSREQLLQWHRSALLEPVPH